MFDRVVKSQAERQPRAPAIWLPNRSVSFGELNADVDRVAWLCRDFQAARDNPVAVAVVEPYLHCVVLLALARLGVAFGAGDDAACRSRISDGDAQAPTTLRLTLADLDRVPPSRSPSVEPVTIDPEAIGRVAVSSGTTGRRKRMGLSWRAIEARVANSVEHFGVPDGPWIAATGPGTTFGFNIMLAAWTQGLSVVLGLDVVDRTALGRFRPRLIGMIPAQLRSLLDSADPGLPRTTLRVIVAGGSVPPNLARRTRLELTDDLRCGYGTTEAGTVAVARLAELEATPAVAGRVLPSADVEVVDHGDRPLPAGTLGHVRIRSNRLISGYLDEEGRLTPALRDGWFHPGDMGRLNADGFLFIEGRSDDVMNIAGHKILPLWVEQAVLASPGIRDAGAFSVSDADGLERCWLAVVCDGPLDMAAIRAALTTQLRWLAAVEVIQVAELPRNRAGKIDRIALRNAVRGARRS